MFESLEKGICICLFVPSRVDMGPHIRYGVKKHEMYIEPKSYKFKLLGKLVIQHSIHKII